jgi:DNA recombination protein RmuC
MEQLRDVKETTNRLQATTGNLHKALAGTQARGQWGERMADDVIRHAGLQEGINYTRQTQTDGARPDFTFLLPGNLRVNMDVKFPLSNYLRTLEAPDPGAADAACKAFLRDVRGRIKEVTSRAYIDAAGGTLDYVLVFIPNERVYAFIHEHDPDLLDDAMRQKVVLCSPLTLYAMLAVIRQSVDNFRLEEVSNEIHRLLLEFRKQWETYVREMDKIGSALEKAKEAYDAVVTTRTRMLERQLDKIDALSEERLVSSPEAGASG